MEMVTSSWRRPPPWQLAHLVLINCPIPWHSGQVVTLTICPKKELCTWRTWPWPAQTLQACSPGPPCAAQEPHLLSRLSLTFLVTPAERSGRVRVREICPSCPRGGSER